MNIAIGLFGLLFAYILFQLVARAPAGGVRLIEWSKEIRKTVAQETRIENRFDAGLIAGIFFVFMILDSMFLWGFLSALFSYAAIVFGMRVATLAINRSIASPRVAYRACAAVGFAIVSLAILEMTLWMTLGIYPFPIGALLLGLRQKSGLLRIRSMIADVYFGLIAIFSISLFAPWQPAIAGMVVLRMIRTIVSGRGSSLRPRPAP